MTTDDEFTHSVYWITPRIAVGRFVSPERANYLRSCGVTHILNVGESPSVVCAEDFGFQQIVDRPIVDLTRVPDSVAVDCLADLHAMLSDSPDSKVYVHCLAGQNRSPTIIWLYLIARGMDPKQAKDRITTRAFDAVPGHSAMVDDALIRLVTEFGAQYLPRIDDELTPAP